MSRYIFYYAECHVLFAIFTLSVIMKSVDVLSVIMLHVIVLNVIMLTVVAPYSMFMADMSVRRDIIF
jgi:hypothetical protein